MTVQRAPTRRQVIQAAGATGVALTAGCLSASGNGGADEEEPTTDEESESLEAAKAVDVDRVAADPRDIPAPIERDHAETVAASLEATEVVAEIEDGATFTYMTFNDQVPGPLVRARVGDTVDLEFTNSTESKLTHNVDFHATRGPGGGAEATTVAPGETEHLRFKATYPGAFVYHCAVPNMGYHISTGMYGVILVEPEDGLPEVDHELYFGQNELYTTGDVREDGHHEYDWDAMEAEDPTYVVVNGEKNAITPDGYGAPTVATDETVRVIWAVGGPNVTSNVHPIGSVWDRLYPQGSLSTEPQTDIQTTPVPPGSAIIGEMHSPVPMDIKLVDHALSRVTRKGTLAMIHVEGEPNEEIFDADPE